MDIEELKRQLIDSDISPRDLRIVLDIIKGLEK